MRYTDGGWRGANYKLAEVSHTQSRFGCAHRCSRHAHPFPKKFDVQTVRWSRFLEMFFGLLFSPKKRHSSIYLLCVGMFWTRTNSYGAMAGFTVGFIIGVSRLISGYVFLNTPEAEKPGFVTLNFLLFGLILSTSSVLVIVATSLLTPPPNPEKLKGILRYFCRLRLLVVHVSLHLR